METEQLKSVLQNFKVKVAELNLDNAIVALDAVFTAKEDLKKLNLQIMQAQATLKAHNEAAVAAQKSHSDLKLKMDAIKEEAVKKLAALK